MWWYRYLGQLHFFIYEEDDDRAKSIDFEALCEYFTVIVRGQISHSCGGIVTLANYIFFIYEEDDDRAKSILFEALCEYFTVIVRGRVSHSYSGVVTLALSGS